MAEYLKKGGEKAQSSLRDSNQFKGQDIRKIEKEPYGYEVTLFNGTDVKFDKTGKFLRTDDSRPSRPAQ